MPVYVLCVLDNHVTLCALFLFSISQPPELVCLPTQSIKNDQFVLTLYTNLTTCVYILLKALVAVTRIYTCAAERFMCETSLICQINLSIKLQDMSMLFVDVIQVTVIKVLLLIAVQFCWKDTWT